MNTVLGRANALVAFTLTVLAALTFGCFLSTAFLDHDVQSAMSTAKVIVKNLPDYSIRERNDLGFITFDLQADMSSLFNWNTKMLFLFLVAEYSTPKNPFNQVVLWDKIVRRGENAVLDFKGMSSKYYFWDDGDGLRANKNVTMTLYWNVIPTAGTLPYKAMSGSHHFQFPSEYQAKM